MENITPPGTPAKRALAVLDEPAPSAVLGPPKRISKKVRTAIDLVVRSDCKQIKEAAEKVGLAHESPSRALSTPHVAEHLRQKVLAPPRHRGRPRRRQQGRIARQPCVAIRH
jgi:hypothetical protein